VAKRTRCSPGSVGIPPPSGKDESLDRNWGVLPPFGTLCRTLEIEETKKQNGRWEEEHGDRALALPTQPSRNYWRRFYVALIFAQIYISTRNRVRGNRSTKGWLTLTAPPSHNSQTWSPPFYKTSLKLLHWNLTASFKGPGSVRLYSGFGSALETDPPAIKYGNQELTRQSR